MTFDQAVIFGTSPVLRQCRATQQTEAKAPT